VELDLEEGGAEGMVAVDWGCLGRCIDSPGLRYQQWDGVGEGGISCGALLFGVDGG